MRSAVAILLAVIVTANSALGCCWRHVENCAGCHVVAHESTCQHEGGCSHDHDEPSSGEPSHEKHSPCRDECRGVCKFLPVERQQVSQPAATGLIAISSDVAEAGALIAVERRTGEAGMLGADPPARLHLLHQLLLI